jgi:hypothetical protein
MGNGKRGNQVNVIDFDLAKKYRDLKTHLRITAPDGGATRGRPAGATTVIRSVSLARRDDLDSLAYVPMYFLRGAVPWQGLKAATKKQKYNRIMEKMTTPTDHLCRGFPMSSVFLNYTRALRFDDKLECSYLRKLFCDLFPARVTSSTTMCSTGVSSAVQDEVPVPVLRQRAVDVKLSRRMRTSHEPATDSKNLICFITSFWHQ